MTSVYTQTDRTRIRLTDEQRDGLLATLRLRPEASILSIAQECQVSHATALRYRELLRQSEGLASVRREYTPVRDGMFCFTCSCGAEVVGGPRRCSVCWAERIQRA